MDRLVSWRRMDKQKMSSGLIEDLYGIDKSEKFRKTLRKIKEKEQLILKLRENCLDLVIKFADAQNTIDELRFYPPREVLPHPQQINSIGYLEKVVMWKTEDEERRRKVGTSSNEEELEEVIILARRVRDKAHRLNEILNVN